eukprot:219685_1
MEAAQDQLSDPYTRRFGFSSFGTYVTPMDVRVMYGDALPNPSNYTWHDRLRKEIKRDPKEAALKYGYELQSKDILGLAAAGINLYNLLFPTAFKILLVPYSNGYDEKASKALIDYNWKVLNDYYSREVYRNHTIMPSNVRTLLIKMHWLAYEQLPENDADGCILKAMQQAERSSWIELAAMTILSILHSDILLFSRTVRR